MCVCVFVNCEHPQTGGGVVVVGRRNDRVDVMNNVFVPGVCVCAAAIAFARHKWMEWGRGRGRAGGGMEVRPCALALCVTRDGTLCRMVFRSKRAVSSAVLGRTSHSPVARTHGECK